MARRLHPSPCLMISSRDYFSSCHIRVPDLDQRLAAIQVGDRYYSFFNVVTDSKRALSLMIKLSHRGDHVVITQLARGGYGLWVWEPDAHLANAASAQRRQKPTLAPASCTVLVSRDQFQRMDIRVPDLEQSVPAILIHDRFYSIFRVETDSEKVIDLVAKITQRGDETAIIRAEKGTAICIYEPDAVPLQPIP